MLRPRVSNNLINNKTIAMQTLANEQNWTSTYFIEYENDIAYNSGICWLCLLARNLHSMFKSFLQATHNYIFTIWVC